MNRAQTLAVLLGIAAAPLGAQAPARSTIDPATNALLERADRGRTAGDSTAPLWIVEVSDFQCPYCKMWHDSTYAALNREFIATGQVRFAYVNFPLNSHEHAVPAAEAAMCAAAQDKFWPLHDRLFRTQPRWSTLESLAAKRLFDSLAVASGVRVPEFRSCLVSGAMRRLIDADRDRGVRAGVRSTPTFFVGDEALVGAESIGAFRAAIARQRAKAARKP